MYSKRERKKCRKTCLTRSSDHGVGWSESGGLPGSALELVLGSVLGLVLDVRSELGELCLPGSARRTRGG